MWLSGMRPGLLWDDTRKVSSLWVLSIFWMCFLLEICFCADVFLRRLLASQPLVRRKVNPPSPSVRPLAFLALSCAILRLVGLEGSLLGNCVGGVGSLGVARVIGKPP